MAPFIPNNVIFFVCVILLNFVAALNTSRHKSSKFKLKSDVTEVIVPFLLWTFCDRIFYSWDEGHIVWWRRKNSIGKPFSWVETCFSSLFELFTAFVHLMRNKMCTESMIFAFMTVSMKHNNKKNLNTEKKVGWWKKSLFGFSDQNCWLQL